jgi:quinol monooxygenase YgiN
MIIVMGWLRVDAADRDAYLAGCRPAIEAARAAPGCAEFHLSVDPIDDDRINVVERWTSVAAVEAFRGSGPSDDQQAAILDAEVVQYEVTAALGL